LHNPHLRPDISLDLTAGIVPINTTHVQQLS
jgi:hypothetical protein